MLSQERLVNFLFEVTSNHDLIWHYDPFYVKTKDKLHQLNKKLEKFRKKFSEANLFGKLLLIGKFIKEVDLSDTDAYYVNLKIDYEIPCQMATSSNISAILIDYEYFVCILHISNDKVNLIDSYGALIADSIKYPELISVYFMAEEFSDLSQSIDYKHFYLRTDNTYTR